MAPLPSAQAIGPINTGNFAQSISHSRAKSSAWAANWETTTAAPPAVLLPNGSYAAIATTGALGTIGQDTPRLRVTFEVVEGPFVGKRMRRDFYLTPAEMPYTKSDLAMLGIKSPDEFLPSRRVVRLSVREGAIRVIEPWVFDLESPLKSIPPVPPIAQPASTPDAVFPVFHDVFFPPIKPPYGLIVRGDGKTALCDWGAAYNASCTGDERAPTGREGWLSAYTFDQSIIQHLEREGVPHEFKGVVSAPYVWFSFVGAAAKSDAIKLCEVLHKLQCDKEPQLFFNGSDGFNIGVPTVNIESMPSTDFHVQSGEFQEILVQQIDRESIFYRNHDLSGFIPAPNSVDPTSGLHVTRFETIRLEGYDDKWIRDLSTGVRPQEAPEHCLKTLLPPLWAEACEHAKMGIADHE